MRVVVTGGSGRAGRFVVRELAAAGHEVTSFDLRPLDGLPGGFCRVDLADAGRVYDALCQYRPEGVCHLAADPAPSGQARIEVFDGNVTSAYHVLQAAGDLGVPRCVYASSLMATGLLTEGLAPCRIPFDESERHPTPNAYALSKYLSEVIAESLASRYPATAYVGLRINVLIEPERRDAVDRRRADPARGSSSLWSYIDARDVGSAFRAALEGDSDGHEVFAIAAADICADRPLRELMAEFYDGYDRVAEDHGDFASPFDCGKIERFFGWRPSHSWRHG